MSSAEIEGLRAELEALRLTVVSQGERIAVLEAAGVEGATDHFTVVDTEVSAGSEDRSLISGSDRAGREELARQCGRFLRRASEGIFRGSSGRERLKLANRIYVVLVDFEGVRRSSPLVTDSFSEVKAICKRGTCLGASVFLGFATKWEAEIAVAEAGYA